MEGEKKHSKGSFFHLFDWSGKSRKKLFVNNSEVPETPKLVQENVESILKFQLLAIDEDDRRANSSNKASSDFSSASSVNSDEGNVSRAPGVVARLMGLDSLPTSNAVEPFSTPFFNSSSCRASQDNRGNPHLWSEYNRVDYFNHSSNQGGCSGNSLEPRSQKVQNRPIERFQTEMLPPKSAKPIPYTNNKLLSPIKSPAFISTKNADYIMEAAAKIIEASPKATIRGKMPSMGPSSIPLRIQDMKQKMEAARTSPRPPRSAKNNNAQHSGRSSSGSEGIASVSQFSEKAPSGSLRSKRILAQSNVPGREQAGSSNSNVKKLKEQKEISSNYTPKNLSGAQKTNRISENRTNNVLRQNNQKQNCPSTKAGSTSKNSISTQAGRKPQTMNGSSVGQCTTASKASVKPETSKKMHSACTDSVKAKPHNMSLKRRAVNSELQTGRSVSYNASLNGDKRSIKCNITDDRCMSTGAENQKSSMDVVSFTFTSPIKRTTSNSPSVMGKSNSSVIDLFASKDHLYSKSVSSFTQLNVIGGDALGVLLEQKLHELSNKVESSKSDMTRDGTYASLTSSLQNALPRCNAICTIPADQPVENKSEHHDNLDCLSAVNSRLKENLKWQGLKEIEEYCATSHLSINGKNQHQSPSSVSTTEPSSESGSVANRNDESDEVVNGFATNESLELEGESELSDSASSMSAEELGRKHIMKTFSTTEYKESSDWELAYVNDVVNNAELTLKDFRSDIFPKVINPHLFHQLENQEDSTKGNEGEQSKLERKVLFDCIGECLELMCGQIFTGSCKSWAVTRTLFRRNGWLAKELYREILCWKSMGDLMVEELVDKDMSSRYGKWLDFNVEAFEQGIDIGKGILTCLIDELVYDLFIL